MSLIAFVAESNAIEGIRREPSAAELAAHEALLALETIGLEAVCAFQAVIAPGKPLRERRGMNVRVGSHIAPEGGPGVVRRLSKLLGDMNAGADPWACHVRFETLHPFMDGNGRTGRALWAWQMERAGRDPFALPFLHRFYYQTLEHAPDR